MTTTAIAFDGFVLPWEATRREDERFRRILKRLFLAFLLFRSRKSSANWKK
jgi:hypothetical protein